MKSKRRIWLALFLLLLALILLMPGLVLVGREPWTLTPYENPLELLLRVLVCFLLCWRWVWQAGGAEVRLLTVLLLGCGLLLLRKFWRKWKEEEVYP